MAERFTGAIAASLAEPLEEVFDFSSEDLGTCWVSCLKNNGSAPYKPEITVHSSDERKVIIPSRDDDTLFTEIETMVQEAGEMVCVSSFLIQQSRMTDALLEAAARGVSVFVLTAREDDLKKADEDLVDFERERIKDHVTLLNTFGGKVLVRTSQSFHAKYVLTDPCFASASGIMMTCNATVDPMSGSNIEVALTLTTQEARSFFAHFLRGFWMMADHELLEPGELVGVTKEVLPSVNLGELRLPATVGDVHSLQEQVLALIHSTEKELVLTAWSFDDGPIKTAIMDACRRGVTVTILTRPSPRNTTALRDCAVVGATIFGHPRLHAKCVVADGRAGLVMTANMTALGLESGFETSVPLKGRTLAIVMKIVDEWRKACTWNLKDHATPAMVEGSVKQISPDGRTLDERTVIHGEKKDLPAFRPDSCDKIPGYTINQKEIDKIRARENLKVFGQITLKQQVIPPRLPEGAKGDVQKDIPFPVFRKGKEKYIVVRTWEDVRTAQKAAQKLNAKIVVGE
jgi:cardiolipin synthase